MKNKSLNNYYIYGVHTVLSAIQNLKRKTNKIFCTKNILNQHLNLITQYKHEVVTNDFLNKLLIDKRNHQGIVADVEKIFQEKLDISILQQDRCNIAILDQVQDIHNIGSIIRNAAAFNIDAVILTKNHSPNENSVIAKVASGGLDIVNIIQVANLRQLIMLIKSYGFWVIGFDNNSTESIDKSITFNKIAVVLGSESSGLRRLTREHCDYLLKIPISNNINSLNIASTTAIVFYMLSLR